MAATEGWNAKQYIKADLKHPDEVQRADLMSTEYCGRVSHRTAACYHCGDWKVRSPSMAIKRMHHRTH